MSYFEGIRCNNKGCSAFIDEAEDAERKRWFHVEHDGNENLDFCSLKCLREWKP